MYVIVWDWTYRNMNVYNKIRLVNYNEQYWQDGETWMRLVRVECYRNKLRRDRNERECIELIIEMIGIGFEIGILKRIVIQ